MGGAVIRKDTYHSVRQLTVDAATLDRIADALGIPRADLAGAVSIEIHVAQPSASGASSPGTGSTGTTP
jgi:hypothetical protein